MADTVGSILLVGITIVMATAFAFLLFQFEGPDPVPHSSLAISVAPGLGGWGTGDETLRIAHNGGEELLANVTQISVRINGVATVLTGTTGLGGAFADGKLTIGETWVRTQSLAGTDSVAIHVLDAAVGTRVLSNATLVPSQVPSGSLCPFDSNAPTAAGWAQLPANIQSTTAGAITVNVTLTDDCRGVDQTATPQLYWCLTNAPPCASGTMTGPVASTHPATDKWQAVVPAQTWVTQVGKTLEYEFRQVKDVAGNSGTTARNTDLVDIFIAYNYVNTKTDTIGATGAFANAQSATDGNAQAVVAEGGIAVPAGSAGPTKFSGTTAATGSATNPTSVVAADDTRATMGTTSGYIELSGFDLPAGASGVTAVTIGFEGRKSASGGLDPTARLDYKLGAGAYDVGTPFLLTASTDTDQLRVLTGTFSVADVEGMTIRLFHVADTNRDMEIDHMFATVLYTTAATTRYEASVQFDWTGLPPGNLGTHSVELNYATTGDTFNVNVWNWLTSTWTPRGSTLNSASLATWSYLLTAQEFSPASGLARIQFVDVTPTGGTQGNLNIEYARVATT